MFWWTSRAQILSVFLCLGSSGCFDFNRAWERYCQNHICAPDGSLDAGEDGGTDAGVDGSDAGFDGGSDAGVDAGPPCPETLCYMSETPTNYTGLVVWGSSSENVYLGGEGFGRWNGSVFQQEPLGSTGFWVRGISGASANDVWVVGDSTTFYRWNGTQWLPHSRPLIGNARGLWVRTSMEAYACLDDTILRWDGASWQVDYTTTSGGSGTYFNGVWVDPTTGDVWAIKGNREIHLRTAGTWALETTLGASGYLHAVGGSSPNNVWVVGDDGFVGRRTDAGWAVVSTEVPTTVDLNALWVAADGTPWVVGSAGNIYKGQPDGGLGKVNVPGPTGSLYGVYGFSPDELWVAPANGSLTRYRRGR